MGVSRHQILSIEKRLNKVQAQNFRIIADGNPPPSLPQFAEAMLGNPPDEWQADYFNNAATQSLVAIAASRQSGKSTAAAIVASYYSLFINEFEALIASRSLRQAGHFLSKVRSNVLSIVPPSAMRTLNRLSMELPNGSQMVSIPCAQPDAGRGFSPHLFLLDEAAFAPEELFTAIEPSLAATNGAQHMISSPNGRAGQFFEAFEGRSASVYWTRRVTCEECPRITPETLERYRIRMGDIEFRQEFYAEFLAAEGAFFGHDSILKFEGGETQDLSLLELEKTLDDSLPEPSPTLEDLQAAFDRADRVQEVLYD